MDNEKIKISVIMTIHNAEKYIRECMESVLNQTFSEIEVLCIDGGSTDGTPHILKEYAERDLRIRIINDANTSYGHKVNRGIEEAVGEYISVVESDDMYEPYMLEKLYAAAERYHTDFVNADYTCFFDINGQKFGYTVKMYPEENYNCVINYKECPERFGIIPRYWTGLFRKDYLVREDIKMNESPGASYQDMSFRFLTSILAERAYHLDIPVYLYRIDNPESSMYDSKKTIVIAEEHEFLRKVLLKRNIRNRFIWHNLYQWKYTDFRGNMRHLKGRYREELFDRYLEELEKDREDLARYAELGYSQWMAEMITESPETVARLIEGDAKAEKEREQQQYQFLRKVSYWDKGKKAVVFGCGKRGGLLLELLRFEENRICCLTDNSETLWNTVKQGHKILAPADAVIQYSDAFYIVANKFHAEEIVRQLRGLGIPEDRIYIF